MRQNQGRSFSFFKNESIPPNVSGRAIISTPELHGSEWPHRESEEMTIGMKH